ncbi:hypothetical protein HID58_046808, partial [Brassica napus]
VLGITQESISSYLEIIKRNMADESSSLSVCCEQPLIALKGLTKLWFSQTLDANLSKKQKEATYANCVHPLLHANEMDQIIFNIGTRTLCCAVGPSVVPTLLQAAVLVRETKVAKFEELDGQCAENSRVPIQNNQYPSFYCNCAIIVALKERTGDNDGAAAVLPSAINWCSNSMTENNKLSILILEDASFKLRHGQEEVASRLYEKIVKNVKAQMLWLYPKGFDPANPGPPPDPEIWLLRRERSSYRPRRKDKRTAQIRGSQGSVTKQDKQEAAPATSKSNQATTKSAAAKNKSRR